MSDTASGSAADGAGGTRDVLAQLKPEAASAVRGLIEEQYGITRAGNGNALVLWHPIYDTEQVFYRIYDREWDPVSPLLEVPVGLEVVRGMRSSFLARATLYNRVGTRKVLDEWVIVAANGRMRRVDTAPGLHRLAPSDLRARTFFDHEWALRRSADSVVRIAPRPWESPGSSPYVNDRGAVCVVPRGTRVGEPVYTSIDDGLTWRKVAAEGGDSGADLRVQSCASAPDRVVVMLGRGEYPDHLSVFDRTSNVMLSRITLGNQRRAGRFDPFSWRLLPDGRLVFDARGGVLVATDRSNRRFVRRPGPPGLTVDVVAGDLIDWVPARRAITVSENDGRTWSRVDLSLPPN